MTRSAPVRAYRLSQFLTNERTGEPLFTEQMLLDGLKRRSIKGWAYVLHDRDEGIGEHYHVVFWSQTPLKETQIARWFGVPDGRVEKITGGRTGIAQALRYMTHERVEEEADGKFPYADEDVHASDGWDWRAEITETMQRLASGTRRRSKSMDLQILEDGLSVREAMRRGTAVPINRLRRQRAAHLASLRPHLPRVNFYVHGEDALGAEAIARGIATTLAAQEDGQFYTLRSSIDEYDGESVILVPNAKPDPMSNALDSSEDPYARRQALFEALAPLPDGMLLRTAFGQTQLVHRAVVMSGTASFDDFRRELARTYRLVSPNAEHDSYAHVPVIVPVSADEFSVQVSSMLLAGGAYDEYVELGRTRNAVASIAQSTSRLPADQRAEVEAELMQRQFRLPIEARERVCGELEGAPLTADEVRAQFDDLD